MAAPSDRGSPTPGGTASPNGPADAGEIGATAESGETRDGTGTPIGRRVVLGMLGLGGAGIVAGAAVQDRLSKVLAPVQAIDKTGLSQLIPAAGRFRIYSVVDFLPHRSEADYRLKVSGLIDRPVEYTVADLRSLEQTRLVKDFQCVTGWRVAKVPWTGVRLSTVLAAAGVRSGAKAVTFRSFDGAYTESLTLDQAARPDVIVAYSMEDGSISDAHGGPVRLYVAPMYGYKSCKWLSEISVVDKVTPGYWEDNGYDVDAWIGKSNGRADNPVT